MSLHPRNFSTVPEETAQVARKVFPKGNPYLMLRDQLGVIYEDERFAPLFTSPRGRPAESPGRLAMVLALQFAENLSDRQAANAVRARIDWKYFLGLELADPGFYYSVLSDFRGRVIEGGLEQQLLDVLLERLQAEGLIKKRGRQRTDSTHVLAATRELNRLECVGETLRQALNSLAVVAPDWLLGQVTPEWFERYGPQFEQYRLPKSKAERQELAETIGRDGLQLLQAIYGSTAPVWLRETPAVDILRQMWVQQYYVEDDLLRWRTAKELPPGKLMIQTPYDIEVRYSNKRSTQWTGSKAHLSETCDEGYPHLITNVETTASTTPDVAVTETVHKHLAEKKLLPREHLIDAGYVDAQVMVTGEQEHGVEVIGPVPPDTSWQARAGQGFNAACFAIDWQAQQVTCPQGKQSVFWSPSRDSYSNPVINVRFTKQDCLGCSQRAQCTRSREGPRTLKLRSRAQHVALQQGRHWQTTDEFKEKYRQRAGVEGTISQGVRGFDLRRSRYIGLAKTHLQHVCIAVAINLVRLADWFAGTPRSTSRCSRFAALAPQNLAIGC
ncbi:MAG: IS1182 family transposase [Chloroflexi bacterium]|nr:IS1182 family transposase [Chloroflexota bacterium]